MVSALTKALALEDFQILERLILEIRTRVREGCLVG
jgi:hypothetical protein